MQSQTNLANKAQVRAAEAAIASANAQIQANQAAVETASINLGFTRVVSPIDGIAGVAQAQVGDLVSTSSGSLTTVSTLDPIRDYFTVSEQEYLALQKRLSDSEEGSLEAATHPCRWKHVSTRWPILFRRSPGEPEHRRNPARRAVSKLPAMFYALGSTGRSVPSYACSRMPC